MIVANYIRLFNCSQRVMFILRQNLKVYTKQETR